MAYHVIYLQSADKSVEYSEAGKYFSSNISCLKKKKKDFFHDDNEQDETSEFSCYEDL